MKVLNANQCRIVAAGLAFGGWNATVPPGAGNNSRNWIWTPVVIPGEPETALVPHAEPVFTSAVIRP